MNWFQPLGVAPFALILYDSGIMKTPVPFSVSIVGLSLLLVVVSALAVRSSAPRTVEISGTSATTTISQTAEPSIAAATTTIPDFASAAFPDGDALKGLGADWTFIDQTTTDSTSTVMGLPGLYQTRVSEVKVNGKDIALLLAEASILDQKKLTAALKQKPVKQATIAGRKGYFLSNGFFLVGSSTTMFIKDDIAKTWPTTLSAEVLSYIGTVRVP